MTNRPDEFSIIAEHFAPLAGEGTFSLRDDAAQVKIPQGETLVITQDACAEGIHFFKHDEPGAIAKKALRVNLSDLAAKGARPLCFSLAFGLSEDWTQNWIAEFANGLAEDIETFGIGLSGGDTFRTGGGTVVSITATGTVPEEKYISRLGAKPGDRVFVTGTIGDAALGLQARLGNLHGMKTHLEFLRGRYLLPEPRVDFAEIIREFASASMDVSDGLVGDLEKLCKASEVSACLKLSDVPFSEAANVCIENESKWLETAVTGGDDYEILFTVPQSRLAEFKNATNGLDLPVTEIGEITVGEGVRVFDRVGKKVEFQNSGYNHSGESR